jgi:hypothetical protein
VLLAQTVAPASVQGVNVTVPFGFMLYVPTFAMLTDVRLQLADVYG